MAHCTGLLNLRAVKSSRGFESLLLRMNKQIMYLMVILVVIFLTVFLLVQNQGQAPEQLAQNQMNNLKNNQPTAIKALPTPKMQIDQNKTYQALLKTTEGEIKIDLNVKDTPITANNFVYLAKKGFYNKTIFHRVIEGFMIQGGDPLGNGTGGPDYRFNDEPFEGEYARGTVAMANSGPNTNGSQFFIMHEDYALPKDYVIFGQVVEGIEVVDKIASAAVQAGPSGEASSPVEPVAINKVTIIEE